MAQYQSIHAGTSPGSDQGVGYRSIFESDDDYGKRKKKKQEDELAKQIADQQAELERKAEEERKAAEDKARLQAGKGHKSIFENIGDAFEANSPQDKAKREALGQPADYKEQQNKIKENENKAVNLDMTPEEVQQRKDFYARNGVDLERAVKNKDYTAIHEGMDTIRSGTIFGKKESPLKDVDIKALADKAEKEGLFSGNEDALKELENARKLDAQGSKSARNIYAQAIMKATPELDKKKLDKVAEDYLNVAKTATGTSQNVPQQAGRGFARGVSWLADLPSNAQSFGSNALDVVSPEGSRLDKFAQERFTDAAKDNADVQQQKVDKGVGDSPVDNRVVMGLSQGAGSLATSVGLGTALSTGEKLAEGASLWANTKAFMNPLGVGALFGVNEGGEITRDAKDSGASDLEALGVSSASGYAEAVLENWGLGKLLGAEGNLAKQVFVQALTEGSQEFFQDFSTSALQATYKEIDWSNEFAKALESGAYGAVLGGGASIGTTLSNNLQKEGVEQAEADYVGQQYEEALRTKAEEKAKEQGITPEEPVPATPVEKPAPSVTEVKPVESGPSEVPGANITVPPVVEEAPVTTEQPPVQDTTPIAETQDEIKKLVERQSELASILNSTAGKERQDAVTESNAIREKVNNFNETNAKEILVVKNPSKNWKGADDASIKIVEYAPDHFSVGTSFAISTAGSSKPIGGNFKTESDAVEYAIQQGRKFVESNSKDATTAQKSTLDRISRELDSLEVKQGLRKKGSVKPLKESPFGNKDPKAVLESVISKFSKSYNELDKAPGPQHAQHHSEVINWIQKQGFSYEQARDMALEANQEFAKNNAPQTSKTGSQVANEVKKMGSDQGGISDFTADQIKKEDYTTQTVSINDLRKSDQDLDDYINGTKKVRAYKGTANAMPPIVTSKGEVIDGYNRIHQAVVNGESEIIILKGTPTSESNPKPKGAVKPLSKKKATESSGLSALDDKAQAKFGKPADKLSKTQLKELMVGEAKILKAGIGVSKKFGVPTTKSMIDEGRPALNFGGKVHHLFTNGYIAITDKTLADKINDEIAAKEVADRIKAIQLRASEITFAEAKAIAEKDVAKLQEDMGEQYPKIQKGTELSNKMNLHFVAGNEATVVGYELKGDVRAILTDGKIDVVIDNDYLAFFDKHFPNATYRVSGQLDPVQVVDSGEVVGVIMPLKETAPKELQSENKVEPEVKAPTTRTGVEASVERHGDNKGGEGRFREENARTLDEMVDLIIQLNKVGQMHAILRLGGLRSKTALGHFQWNKKLSGKEKIKLRDDVIKSPQQYMDTLAHELWHGLEWVINGTTGKTYEVFGELTKEEKKQIQDELHAIVDNLETPEVASKKPGYYYKPTEMMARFIETMLLQPTKLAELAPLTLNKFELAALQHPEIQDLMAAIKGEYEKHHKQVMWWKDLNQIFKAHLGDKVGNKAYANELARRRNLQHVRKQVEDLIKSKFKGVKDKQSDLFQVAESVHHQEANGDLVFGTSDYILVYDKKEAKKRTLDGFTFNKLVLDNRGEQAIQLKRERYSAEEGERLFKMLSEKGQQLIREYTAPAEVASDLFSRELMKKYFDVGGEVEGWVYRGLRAKEKGAVRRLVGRKTNFKEKKAGTRNIRGVGGGELKNLEKQLLQNLIEVTEEKIGNDFIKKQLATISKPIAKGQEPDAGWVEVMASKKGLILPSDTGRERVTIITQEADSEMDDMMSMSSPQIISKKTFLKPQPRVQVPISLYNRYRSLHGLQEEMTRAQRITSNIANYWQVNILLHPGTVGTNAIGGAVFYAGYLVDGFYKDLVYGLSGDAKSLLMQRTRRRLLAPLQAFNWRAVDSAVYGGVRSTMAGQFMTDNKTAGYIDKMGNILLRPFGAVENYWKRAIAIAEGGSHFKTEALGKEIKELTRAEEIMLSEINKAVDDWALDYDNTPDNLQNFNSHPIGKLTKPFIKYPYKYTKKITSMVAAPFDGNKTIQERMVATLTLTTIMSLSMFLSGWRDDERETPNATDGTPQGLDPQGRVYLGRQGVDELFIRTSKYPFVNLTTLGKQIYNKQYSEAGALLTDQLGGMGPVAKSGLALVGSKSEYDKYTPTNQIIAKELGSFIPASRILKDVASFIDPVKRKPADWKQEIAQYIPIGGSDETKEKYRGEPRTIKVPKDQEGVVRKKGDIQYDERILDIYTQDLALSFLTGIYITRINPDEAKADALKTKRNTAETEIEGLLLEGKISEAQKVASENEIFIPKGTYDYYKRKRFEVEADK